MQKVINVLAVLSFVGVAGIIGGGAYIYTQRDAMIENAKEKITNAATETYCRSTSWNVGCSNA